MTLNPQELVDAHGVAHSRHQFLARHTKRVWSLATRMGASLGLQGDALRNLELAAVLHDVGKISVPDSVLLKAGPLDLEEWDLMRRHPLWGAEMITVAPGLEQVAQIVLTHHERFDGLGYPIGLRGEEISTASKVIAVCDAYDAIVSDRPYRRAQSSRFALKELRSGAGSQFDPDIVAGFSDILSEAA